MATPTNPKPPKQGDVVLYVDPHMGDVYPGIVTKVLAEGKVLLTALPPGITPYPVSTVVEYAPVARPPVRNTWHERT
jgi:hypothetical protein